MTKNAEREQEKVSIYYCEKSEGAVNLTVAHLRIGHMEGNPDVGNSEYMGHHNCPPQLQHLDTFRRLRFGHLDFKLLDFKYLEKKQQQKLVVWCKNLYCP